MGEDVSQFIRDYVFQVGVALVALTAVAAAWIRFRRRPYVKSVEFKRGVEALRLELRRSADETRTTAAKKAAAVGDKLISVIKPIDANVAELNVRLARLEECADSFEAFMAGPQKNFLQENEQIAARLRKLEKQLTALTDQVSSIEHTLNRAHQRDQETTDSIETRLTSTEKQIGDSLRRLEVGERARADLGGLISLFVKQLKRVDRASVDIAVRVAEFESLRSKIAGLEERLSSTPAFESSRSAENFTTNEHAEIGHASLNLGDQSGSIETNNASTTSTEESFHEPEFPASRLSANSSAGSNGHA